MRTGLWQLNISRHYIVFSFFIPYFTYYLARDSCKKWQEIINKLCMILILNTIFFSSFFSFEELLRTGLRQLKISRHFFVFSFFLSNDLRELDWDSWKFLVTILFFFFLFFLNLLLTYYLARDSCKKWQEIIGKAGLIS